MSWESRRIVWSMWFCLLVFVVLTLMSPGQSKALFEYDGPEYPENQAWQPNYEKQSKHDDGAYEDFFRQMNSRRGYSSTPYFAVQRRRFSRPQELYHNFLVQRITRAEANGDGIQETQRRRFSRPQGR
ncbi:unnamed protein product [Calicophoron daubneyi]|uniref:Uncharacterized protein n=1 Tax=Calicophoron daubneyi TaxID=300641 RepID=A0AAV2T9F7_CALDB